MWTLSFFYIIGQQKHGGENGLPVAIRTLKIGTWLTLVGITGVVISGSILFLTDWQTFLHSKKFLANMAAMVVLLVVEIFSFRTLDRTKLRFFRIASVFLWTWILLVALFVPR